MFKSPSTGEDCTAPQLLAEIMVQREIDKKKEKAPIKFWNFEPWKKKFKQQIIAANSLLRVYSPTIVLLALKRKECSWCYSLRTPVIADVCLEEQKKYEAEQKQIDSAKQIEVSNSSEFRQINSGQKSMKSRLD